MPTNKTLEEQMYEKVRPLWNKIKRRYSVNLEGLEPAIIQDIAGIVSTILSAREKEVREEEVKTMVDRFLVWKLPADFNPDGGISYTRPNYAPNVDATPTGTNLLTAVQAESMVRHMLGLSQDTKEVKEK